MTATPEQRMRLRYCCRAEGEELMPKKNSVGMVAGLAFVALFLVMIASIQGVAKFTQAPAKAYALAGNSKP